jgi:hypothetical protein
MDILERRKERRVSRGWGTFDLQESRSRRSRRLVVRGMVMFESPNTGKTRRGPGGGSRGLQLLMIHIEAGVSCI